MKVMKFNMEREKRKEKEKVRRECYTQCYYNWSLIPKIISVNAIKILAILVVTYGSTGV